MKTTKTTTITSKHPLLFGFIFTSNILSLFLGIDYLAGTLMATLVFVGAPMLYRFKIKRERVSEGLAMGITSLIGVGWFMFQAVATGGAYTVTLLFILGLSACYKILKFDAEETPAKTA